MAKSTKTVIPTISSPNPGMLAWLNNQSGSESTGESPGDQKQPDGHDAGQPVVTTSVSAAELASQEVVKQPDQPTDPQSVEEQTEIALPEEAAPVAEKRKQKSKGIESNLSGKSYAETFFKKQENQESGGEFKPVRITEESHWLLSVLVEEARRQGSKLTVGDFIQNLLADHRIVHKEEVDTLIGQWKTRKKIS